MSTSSTIANSNAATSGAVFSASMRRVSWGAIAAGVVVAVALKRVSGLLGAGLGMGKIAPPARSTLKCPSLGIGAVVRVSVSSAVALFAADAIASYLSGSAEKSEASLHDLVTEAVA